LASSPHLTLSCSSCVSWSDVLYLSAWLLTWCHATLSGSSRV
jgi:hypothetical protein